MAYLKPDSPESEAVFAEIRGVLDSLPYTAPECRAAKVGKIIDALALAGWLRAGVVANTEGDGEQEPTTRYWLNLGDGEGFQVYDTEHEMLYEAVQVLEEARADASEFTHWPDDVVENEWTMGTMNVTHRVTRVPREGRDLADVGWATNDVDYVWRPELEAKARDHVEDIEDLEGNPVDEDEPALWHVRYDDESPEAGAGVEGYNDGDRGLIALAFAGGDIGRWKDGGFDHELWVRRVGPDEETGPGQLFWVCVQRVDDMRNVWRDASRPSGDGDASPEVEPRPLGQVRDFTDGEQQP